MMTEKESFIQLKKDNILRLKVKTNEGKETGEVISIDLEDIELPLRYQNLVEQDKKNRKWIRDEFIIIDKRQDVKGKKIMSKNEEDKIKALNTFFNKEVEIYNLFLGENGVQKLLNGRKLGWTSLDEIDEIIEKQIFPYLNTNMENISKKIQEKYSYSVNRSKEVLEWNVQNI